MKSRSKFLAWNGWDFMKGLILAIIAAVITYLYTAVQTDSWWNVTTLKKIGVVALTTFLSYLLKNLFTNSKDEILKPE